MLPSAPESLGTPIHPPPYGRFVGPLGDPGIAAWDTAWWPRRRWQRKSWIYAGVFHDDWLLGVALADAGYLALAFAYFFHRPSGTFLEEKTTRPFGFPRAFAPSLGADWRLGRFRARPDPGGWRFELTGRRLAFDLRIGHSFAGLTAIAPAGARPFNSTYKLAAVPVDGGLTVDGRPHDTHGATAVIDFTLGYPPRRTFWNWACLTGHTADGRSLGVNLVAHFNEGLENALWVDGALIPLAQAQFQPGADRRHDVWRIDTADERLAFDFQPEGARSENLQLGLIQSRFIQPFGGFRGFLRENERDIPIRGYGIVEEHRALW